MKINENKSLWQWGYLACFFAILLIPVVNIPPWFYPAAFGQAMLFRIIFAIALVIFTAEIALKERTIQEVVTKLKQAWLPITFFGLISLSYITSTLFSLQPHISFWGDPSRGGGSLNFLLLQAFALLMFLVVKKEDWKKIITFAIFGGVLVSCIAFAQQFSLISKDILVAYTTRPPGSLGNTDFLALYLVLLFFPSLALGYGEIEKWKKVFYWGCAGFFLIILGLTVSRAGFLAMGVGLCYFLFFYRKLENKKVNALKIITGISLCLAVLSVVYYANTRTTFAPFIEHNKILRNGIARLSLSVAQKDARVIMWENICMPMLKEVPVLGYGPENFSIGFDKFYSPKVLPFANAQWWDKAHNIIFDTIFTLGIPGLVICFAFYGIIFFLLEKKKRKKSGGDYITPHSLQAVFIAYFINLLFNFDTFATYLIFFTLIAFSLALISNEDYQAQEIRPALHSKNVAYGIIIVIGLMVSWCIWQWAIMPLYVNGEINYALLYRDCDRDIKKMEGVLQYNTPLNSYAELQYAGILAGCLQKNISNANKEALARKGIEILESAVKKEPYYTRSWMYLSAYATVLIGLDPNDKALQEKSDYYLKQASILSPGRSEILAERAKRYINTGEYEKAISQANACIAIDPEKADCYLYNAGANINLGNINQAKQNLILVSSHKFDAGTIEASLNSLAKIYIKLTEKEPRNLENYRELAVIYQKLLALHWNNYQYHASLAFVYEALGERDKAAYEALMVFYFSPESKSNVDAFLQQIHYAFERPDNAQYHLTKAKEYHEAGEQNLATKEALIANYILPRLNGEASQFIENFHW